MNDKRFLRKRNRWILHLILIFSIVVSILPMGLVPAKADQKVIRVGYDSNSKFIQEERGVLFGYGVEYLQKIAEYTGWKFVFVKDKSWHDSIGKLRKGEIDLICTMHYTVERGEEFAFATLPMGYENSILYARPDSKIAYQDFEAMKGTKIGFLRESYSAQEFEPYAQKVGIEYKKEYFEREDEMLNALEKGDIDMMVVGSRYANPDLKLVDKSGANAFYCASREENQAMVDEIEVAIQQIMFDDPTFEGELNKKYFSQSQITSAPLFTKDEIDYIEKLGTVKIKILQNQKPSCYVEDGETKGIWAELVDLIAKKSGVDFVLEASESEVYSKETYEKLLDEGYLLFRTQKALEHMQALEGIVVSNPVAQAQLSYVRMQDAFVEDKYTTHAIAITKDLAYLEPIFLAENTDHEIKYYDDTKSCLEALVNNEVCYVVQNSHRVSYLMQKPEYTDKLVVVPGEDHGSDVCIVGTEDLEILIQIINKAIRQISDREINEIIKRQLLMTPYAMENEDIWYQYWEWIVVVAVIIIVALMVYTFLTQRMANLKIEKKEYEILQKKIQLDEITGLYNRTYFYELAQDFIDSSDEDMCIITMDVANFKVVNEIYGMKAGDRLLKEIGQKFRDVAKNHKMIASRFMSDHFYICVTKSEFDKVELPKSFKTFLEDIDIKVIYGVYIAEKGSQVPINVMCDRAFVAAHSKNYTYTEHVHYYDDAERKQIMMEKEIENDMERALNANEFYIVVQPKYNAQTETVVGGETLVRWQHPQKGFMSPGVFIPVFEKNGFIVQLDYYVWEETCKLIAKMKNEGIRTVPISVNVSRAHFYGSELVRKLTYLVEKYDLKASDIEIEITESICGEDHEIIYDSIRELQSLGFKIAMDDFGSGYSSLNMLKEMPLDILKMDLKFLEGDQSKGQKILKALIEMAYTLNLKVVVEGVELASQAEFIRQFEGCLIQGYYYSKPIVGDAFEEMVENNA